MLEVQLSLPMRGAALAVAECFTLAGETIAIFGPSGVGKTRLLRSLAGLDARDAGRAVGAIRYDGTLLLDSARGVYVPAHKRPIAYAAQRPALFAHLSVAENIAFAAKRSYPGAPQMHDVIALLGLAPLLKQRPDTLSGGEQLRVALARAAVQGAPLLLLDEPMAALDRPAKLAMMDAIETLQSAFGISILLVSHALEDVLRLASHSLILSAGGCLAYGPTLEVFERIDQSQALGQFDVGSIFAATVSAHDTALYLTQLDVRGLPLSMPLLERIALGSSVRLRVRARDVAIARARPQGLSIRNIVPATVVKIQQSGDSAFVDVTLQFAGQTLLARITRAALQELALSPGDDVFALIKSVSFDRRMF
ncbi:MAG: molybdenum ABC transporter ATP-binding protein [Pseudomonadota bacterium]